LRTSPKTFRTISIKEDEFGWACNTNEGEREWL
jgi:hypothetical protein